MNSMLIEYPELLYHIYKYGSTINSRGLETKESLNTQFIIKHTNLFYHDVYRPLEKVKKYLYGELAWYMSGSRSVDDIAKYSKFWNKIKNRDGTVNSNYGYLVFYKANKGFRTSYQWCLDKLRQDSNTRKAVMLYNDRDYFYEDNKDLICTQLQQFFIRNGILLSSVYIRSSDAIKGLTYDIPWWSIVQQQLAMELNVGFSDITVIIGSVHIYESDYTLVKNMTTDGDIDSKFVKLVKPMDLGKNMKYYEEHIDSYFQIFKLKLP